MFYSAEQNICYSSAKRKPVKRGNTSFPKCGELWMCDLPRVGGSVQYGIRPVFILSNDKNNCYAPTVNVLPITSKLNKRCLPVHVDILDYKKYGLDVPSTIMAEQLLTVPAYNLKYKMGDADVSLLCKIGRALSIQMPVISHVADMTSLS